MHKKILIIVISILGLGLGYYFSYNRGWEQAVEKRQSAEQGPGVPSLGFLLTTGQVKTGVMIGDRSNIVVIEVWILGDLDEFWVEYGADRMRLDRATEHDTNLGLGSPESYRNFTRVIPESDLKPGTLYFYRAVGLKNGVKVYSGISAFQANK